MATRNFTTGRNLSITDAKEEIIRILDRVGLLTRNIMSEEDGALEEPIEHRADPFRLYGLARGELDKINCCLLPVMEHTGNFSLFQLQLLYFINYLRMAESAAGYSSEGGGFDRCSCSGLAFELANQLKEEFHLSVGSIVPDAA